MKIMEILDEWEVPKGGIQNLLATLKVIIIISTTPISETVIFHINFNLENFRVESIVYSKHDQ